MIKAKPILLFLLLITALKGYAQQDSITLHYSVDDIVVSARQQVISEPDRSGNVSINMSALQDMPRFAGTVDIVKLLQYTPGVVATQEGNTSLYVRGGDSGQSRILINGVPLYTPSHLLGFFSVLNPAHLSGLTLYKSGIPASYGSSTASVTDIRTHAYIPQKFSVEGNIGAIESDAAMQIPIAENFGLFLSARHSYTSWITSLVDVDKTAMQYDFGDYGFGIVGELGKLGRLTINTHYNNDITKVFVHSYGSDGNLNLWNGLGNVTLDSRIGKHITTRNTLYSSIYNNYLDVAVTGNRYGVSAGVESYGASNHTTIDLNAINLTTGINYEYRRVRPQYIVAEGEESSGTAPLELTHEGAIFVNANYRSLNDIDLNTGIRLSLFKHDCVWCYPEPRISLSAPLTATMRIWASYDMMAQYLLLAPQSNMSFATDFYVSSSSKTPPQLSHNLSLGVSDSRNNLRYSVELYYRYMSNAIEYDTSVFEVLTGENNYTTHLYSGIGESYGVETNIGYTTSTYDIQLNYTLSRSLRQFDEINGGTPYPAHSDRRHNLSLLASWRPSPRWTLAATFVYATGAPYTATKGILIAGNNFLKQYGSYNGGRLPDMHHLDLSATYWFKRSRDKHSGINLSVYNVYAHKNPLMISWDVSIDDNKTIHISEKEHTVYTIMPSISWIFKF